MANKKAIGRPTIYTKHIVEYLLMEIMLGKSLRYICEANKCVPARSTIYEWLRKYKEFSDQYARSCVIRRYTICDHVSDAFRLSYSRKHTRFLVTSMMSNVGRMEARKYIC